VDLAILMTPTPPELNAAPAPCVKAPLFKAATHVNVAASTLTVIETRTPAALVLSVITVCLDGVFQRILTKIDEKRLPSSLTLSILYRV